MLSQTSRQEVVRRLQAKVGFPFEEANLTSATRQAITNLATVQRHLLVITELLRGEESRIQRSTFLRLASKVGEDSEKKERAEYAAEIQDIQAEVDSKLAEIADRIVKEVDARQAGQPPPQQAGQVELVQLKCPSCGASLPLPTGRFVKCGFCSASLSVQEVSSQMKSVIQSI